MNIYPVEVHAALDLCYASYQDVEQIGRYVTKTTPLDSGGTWVLAWGPALHLGNLAYVAAYTPPSVSIPTAYAVVVRGTKLKKWEVVDDVNQLLEDTDVVCQKHLPWKNPRGAYLAEGTIKALEEIQELQSDHMTLKDFLTNNIPEGVQTSDHAPLLLVTGHSLGGCVSLPLALWIHEEVLCRLPLIQPISFAALTAGNQAFIKRCAKAFPTALGYGNDLDVFVHCWHNIFGILSIYSGFSTPCPTPAWLSMALIGIDQKFHANFVSYSQQSQGYTLLKGQFQKSLSWGEEMMSQHHLANYYALLGFSVLVSTCDDPQKPDQVITLR